MIQDRTYMSVDALFDDLIDQALLLGNLADHEPSIFFRADRVDHGLLIVFLHGSDSLVPQIGTQSDHERSDIAS